MQGKRWMKKWIFMLSVACAAILLAGCHATPTPEFNSTPPNFSSILTDGLDGNYVKDLLIRGNELWTATPVGAYRWNLETGTYQKYTATEGLADNYVTAIAQDKQGNLWFGTDKGVSRYDGTHWKTFTTKDGLANDFVTTIAVDKQGNLWFGTYAIRSDYAIQSNGVSRYDGRNWQIFTTKDGLPGNDVYAIYGDNQGNVWFGAFGGNGGATRFDGTHWQTFTQKDGLIGGYVEGIYQDQQDKLWFGTINGVSSFDGTDWQTLTIERPIMNPSVGVIFPDSAGNYWFASYSAGVDRYDGVNWQYFDQLGDNWMSADIFAISQDSKGNLWFATGGGLIRYDGNAWKTFTVND
jgi:ligand-binding sensor domain-containing protein